ATTSASPRRVSHRRSGGATCMSARCFTVPRRYGSRPWRANFWPRSPGITFWWSFERLCVRCAHMRGIHYLIIVCALAACGDDGTTTITCGDGAEGALPLTITAGAGKDLRGAA